MIVNVNVVNYRTSWINICGGRFYDIHYASPNEWTGKTERPAWSVERKTYLPYGLLLQDLQLLHKAYDTDKIRLIVVENTFLIGFRFIKKV